MLTADFLIRVIATRAAICDVIRFHAARRVISMPVTLDFAGPIEVVIPVDELQLLLPPALTWQEVAQWHQDKAQGFETFVYDDVARVFRATFIKPDGLPGIQLLPPAHLPYVPAAPAPLLPLSPAPAPDARPKPVQRPPTLRELEEMRLATNPQDVVIATLAPEAPTRIAIAEPYVPPKCKHPFCERTVITRLGCNGYCGYHTRYADKYAADPSRLQRPSRRKRKHIVESDEEPSAEKPHPKKARVVKK